MDFSDLQLAITNPTAQIHAVLQVLVAAARRKAILPLSVRTSLQPSVSTAKKKAGLITLSQNQMTDGILRAFGFGVHLETCLR